MLRVPRAPSTLTVDISDVTIEWLTTQRRTYNGGFPGPTFRLKAGDNLNLKLVNNLGAQPVGLHNQFRDPNTTNLHTHGLHISPQEPQDYVLLEVGPGETYDYNFQLNANQQAGTFWYHAHHHGSTFFQVASGLAGLLIVEDEVSSMSAELDAISCPHNCDKEVPMLLGKFIDYNGEDETFASVQTDIGDPFTVDNTVTPSAGVTLLSYLTDQQTGVSAYMVNGSAVSMNFPTTTPAKPFYLRDLQTVADSAIGGRYVVELGPTSYINREKFTNATYYRYNFDVNTIQEWTFTNTDQADGHPLHMHVTHFQVISYNTYSGPTTVADAGHGGDGAFAHYDLNGNMCDQQHKDFDATTINAGPITVDTTYLGHDTNDRNLAGYARIGEFRDVLLIPHWPVSKSVSGQPNTQVHTCSTATS
ncbi:Hypp8424 [Branchiostoma lanceolatum]|uniref:Hypp8424 protein n=1 Tax=Branchiostoma lanceolatum TaxID=7740 RepID=A0A8J9Z6Y8_BRALA|nr:Hypp8424 [Branchiostoma lanceolatum]